MTMRFSLLKTSRRAPESTVHRLSLGIRAHIDSISCQTLRSNADVDRILFLSFCTVDEFLRAISMKKLVPLLLSFSLLGCAAQHQTSCVRAPFHAKFQDADGDVGPFANMKFSLIRVSDGVAVYRGTTDAQGRAEWSDACRGEQYTIRQDGLIGE
ncbi:hypothetical protein [Burkholderia anthina]|uniref:Lipoprotein n=3 Tax=Burkholderia anthina TaxID=179879 RepID=A0ABS2BEQ9_9BURK|nr:hypothetical protein [Burkholderia anthina]MBM2771355.1 hypothetical protein [Burkholderia anthina]